MKELQKYIELCWQCRHECQKTLFNHSLKVGGDHLASEHVKIMEDCIQICQATADTMVRQSPLYPDFCRVCASTCEACADSCDDLTGEAIENCASICRACASSCGELANSMQK